MLDGDGSDPKSAARLIRDAVEGVRAGDGPALLRLTVPRLSGHSGQDTQAYKGATAIAAEQERDPLRRLRAQLVPQHLAAEEWEAEMTHAGAWVAEARARVEQRLSGGALRMRSGRLAAGIAVEVEDTETQIAATVGVDGNRVPYAAALEFGATTRAHLIEAKNARPPIENSPV